MAFIRAADELLYWIEGSETSLRSLSSSRIRLPPLGAASWTLDLLIRRYSKSLSILSLRWFSLRRNKRELAYPWTIPVPVWFMS